MDKLLEIIRSKVVSVLVMPATAISTLSFITLLLTSMSDGVIDARESLQLIEASSSVQTFLLFVLMWVLNKKPPNDKV